jgi:hypothetical protein
MRAGSNLIEPDQSRFGWLAGYSRSSEQINVSKTNVSSAAFVWFGGGNTDGILTETYSTVIQAT